MKVSEDYIKKCNLDGYAAEEKAEVKRYMEKKYLVQYYQGEHEREYLVMEIDRKGVGNGLAQLFKKGVIQLSWMMKHGERKGEVTVYKKGVVDRVLRWDDLRKAEKQGENYHLRTIVNDESGKELLEEIVVGNGIVVYRGEFDNESWEREGFGIEFDNTINHLPVEN